MVSAAALTWTAFLMGLAAAKNIGQGKILCKRYKMVSLVIMDPKDLVTIRQVQFKYLSYTNDI